MLTLNLKRKYKSHYGVSMGDLTIDVVNPFRSNGIGSNSWNVVIEFYNGNEDEYIYINEYFDTKKQASIFGAKWVENHFFKK